jgi:hypothetical protein
LSKKKYFPGFLIEKIVGRLLCGRIRYFSFRKFKNKADQQKLGGTVAAGDGVFRLRSHGYYGYALG